MANDPSKRPLEWWEQILVAIFAIVALAAVIAILEEVIGLRKFRMK